MRNYEGEDEPHVADDLLELYSLSRLSGDELAAVEEHLLVCPDCQDRLEETDAYVKAMQQAYYMKEPCHWVDRVAVRAMRAAMRKLEGS